MKKGNEDTRHNHKKKDAKQDTKSNKESAGNILHKYQRFGENKKYGETFEQDQDQDLAYYDSEE